jgi:hypothetical protein
MLGVTPEGSSALPMRSNTTCRAKYESVFSSNVMRMSERPYSVIERMTVICGTPFISISSGIVTSRSTSSVA